MRIDLHMHSLISANNGDSIKWESNFHVVRKLYDNGIKMASITDHNMFSKKLYLDLCEIANGTDLRFLPGIEVNVVRLNNSIAHLLILFRDDLNDAHLEEIENISKLKIPKCGVSIHRVNELFQDFDTIRIAHVGKSDYFQAEDLKIINCDAFEISNLNHKNYLSVCRHNLRASIVAFSDTHMWDKYPQQKQLLTFVDLTKSCFIELKEKLKLNKNYVKEY